MRYLRTNTACRITVGPFLDKTDGITPEVALTATNEHLTLMVDDGNVPTLVLDANATASGGNNDMVHVTNDDAGFYDLELTAAQTNYLGRAMLSINYATDHCPVFHELMILPAVIYDAMILGTDLFDVSMTQILGTAVSAPATAGILDVNLKNIANAAVSTSTAQLGVNAVQAGGTAWGSAAITAASIATGAITNAKFAAGAIDAAAIAADAIGASELAADAVTEIASGVWKDATAGDFTTASSIGKALYTGNVVPGGAGGLFIAGTNAATSITTALTANITGNITGNLSGSIGSVASGGITATSIAADAIGASELAADAVAEIADAVWDEATSGHTTAGSTGKALTDANNGASLDAAGIRSAIGLASANLDTQIGDLPTNSELSTALAAADDAVLAAIAALNNLSAAQVNAEVVDALATDTYAEPTGAPAATASLAAKLGRLHQALRNELTVTASAKTFKNDAGADLWSKALSDDGTTYTEAEGS